MMNQMPSVEGFLARYRQLDDEQKAALKALIMAQARGEGALQPRSGDRVEGFLARYRQLDDEQKAALRALIMTQRLRLQPQGLSFAAQMLERQAVQGGEDSSAAPWKSETKELMAQFREENAARRAEAAAEAAARREEIAEARAVWRAENAARAQSVRRTRVEAPPPPEGTHRPPSAAAEILDRHGARSGGEDTSATPSWKSEAQELMAQFQKRDTTRRTEVAAAAAARREEIADAKAVWRAENAARRRLVRGMEPESLEDIPGAPSAAGELLDHHGARSGGEDSSATSPWKSEARELMAGIRKESTDRSAEVARDRAARSTEVREFMEFQRQQIAQARKRWREEGAARSQETRNFMARLRAERRGEWSGVEVVASALPSSPTEIRQQE